MQDHLLHGGLLYKGKCYFTYLPSQIFAAGADGEPAAVAADVGEDLRRGLGVDLPDEGLVVVFLFLQPEILHGLAVVPLDLFLCVAQVSAQLVGAAGTERVGGEREVDPRPGNLPQLVDHVVHVLHKGVVVAVAGVALGAEQMVRAEYDAHALFTPESVSECSGRWRRPAQP